MALEFLDEELDELPRTLVTFLGCSRQQIEAELAGILKAAELHGEVPIFVITEPCFDTFRANGAQRVEFLPAPSDANAVGSGSYARYMRSRYAHVMAKWNVSSEVQLGQSLEMFLESAAQAHSNDIA